MSIEPRNIEELTELRDYKSQVPEKLMALKKVIDEAMRNYQVCDELCYKLPAQDFKLRWDLFSWPKKITDECVELEEKCIRLENKQQVEMEEVRCQCVEINTHAIDAVGRRRREPMRHRRGGAVARVASMAFPAEMRPRGRHLHEDTSS